MLGIFKSLGNSTGKLLSKPLGNSTLLKTLGNFKGLEFEEARNLCGGLLPLFLPEGVEAAEAAESSFRRCHRLRHRYLLQGQCLSVCVCECVCVRERERQRE